MVSSWSGDCSPREEMAPSLISVPTMVTQKRCAALSCGAGRGGGREDLEEKDSMGSPSWGKCIPRGGGGKALVSGGGKVLAPGMVCWKRQCSACSPQNNPFCALDQRKDASMSS